MEEVKRREREKVFAKGRAYASRPTSFKQSLSESSRDINNSHYEHGRYDKKDRQKSEETIRETPAQSPTRQKSVEELAAIKEKKRKLMAKYG